MKWNGHPYFRCLVLFPHGFPREKTQSFWNASSLTRAITNTSNDDQTKNTKLLPCAILKYLYLMPTKSIWNVCERLFYVPLKKFSLIWRRHHCRWWAAKFRPMLGAGPFFIVPHLWHGTSVFPVSSEGPPHFVASYDTHGGYGGPILTRILTELFNRKAAQPHPKSMHNLIQNINLTLP
jgi:hypothetical protein